MAAQEDYDALSAMAERLQLDDEETDNFIGSAMKRLGYKARQMWEDDDSNNSGSGGGDFFSSRRRERRSATPPRRGGSGGNWQYGRGA